MDNRMEWATRLDNIEKSDKRWNKFAVINREGYKNPKMFELEPNYLKTSDYNKEGLTFQQWQRKITELALQLGRTVKKGPEPLENEEAIKIFQGLVGNIKEAEQTVCFYEDDLSQPTRLNAITDLN